MEDEETLEQTGPDLPEFCNGRAQGLEYLSHANLKIRWQEVFGSPSPRNISRRLMICAVAYGIQAARYGGLDQAVVRKLERIGSTRTVVTKKQASRMSPGTRLVREWQGVVHIVDVTEKGFLWNGKIHGSLSAIARAITGTRWNGLTFFGLKKRSEARVKNKASPPHDAEAA